MREAFLQRGSSLIPAMLTQVSLRSRSGEGFCHFCFPGRGFIWSNENSSQLKYVDGAQKVWQNLRQSQSKRLSYTVEYGSCQLPVATYI